METNSKKVLEAMPSFDDFMNLAEEIKKISIFRMKIENQIKTVEAENFKEIMSNPKYIFNGKTVTVSYYESAYKHAGIDNNLIDLREELAGWVALLELNRNKFEVYKQMHDLFKTLVFMEKNMG